MNGAHEQEGQYWCKKCGKAFSSVDNVKRHLRIEHKITKRDYEAHVEAVSGDFQPTDEIEEMKKEVVDGEIGKIKPGTNHKKRERGERKSATKPIKKKRERNTAQTTKKPSPGKRKRVRKPANKGIICEGTVQATIIKTGEDPLIKEETEEQQLDTIHPDSIHPDTIHPDTIHPDSIHPDSIPYPKFLVANKEHPEAIPIVNPSASTKRRGEKRVETISVKNLMADMDEDFDDDSHDDEDHFHYDNLGN